LPSKASDTVSIAAVGLWHIHGDLMVQALVREGAVLAAIAEDDDRLFERFASTCPPAPRVPLSEILENDAIDLLVLAGTPASRAAVAAEALDRGKDVLSDKPCCLTVDQLAAVRAARETNGSHFAVWYGDRLNSRAADLADELIGDGAIGDVVHFVGLGPHQLGLLPRDDAFFDSTRSGGILVDLGCHQIDAFLTYTSSASATVVQARALNTSHPKHPAFEDVGDMTLSSPSGAIGYARVDWYTPDGLGVWGDGRAFIVGTEGTIETRKVIDPGGRGKGEFVILADGRQTQVLDAGERPLRFARNLMNDVRNGTETAMTSEHAFAVCDLALRAKELAAARPVPIAAPAG
jgi:predicted dehydrogenase